MNPIAKLKRLLEDRKYRIIDLKPGHAYFLWIKSSPDDTTLDLKDVLRELRTMNVEMFVIISKEALLIECND